MTFLYEPAISFANTPDLTSFGRLRTAHARLLGEYRYMYGSGSSVEMNDKITGGGTLVADYVRNAHIATLTSASGDRVIRQTKHYHQYIPGTSNLGILTFTLNVAKTNLKQSVGLFDDDNGIIFRMNGLVPEFVIRKQGVDSQIVSASNWNEERFDGSKSKFNPSGHTVDWSKSQILIIDYNWLGLGRVRVGFIREGHMFICHNFEHTNVVTEAYMNQPSLPCRWEIENTGATASSSQLMMICGAVYCEGADIETGFSRSVSTDGTAITLTTANSGVDGRCILAFRLKNTLVGKQNHTLARLKQWTLSTTEDLHYKVVILPNSTYVTGSPTWSTVPGYGWCDYSKNFALTPGWQTSNEYAVILDTFALSGGGTGSNISSGSSPITAIDNKSNAIYQNYDSTDSQIMAIIGFRLNADAAVKASMNWIEVK
jgi:hypothetical protein